MILPEMKRVPVRSRIILPDGYIKEKAPQVPRPSLPISDKNEGLGITDQYNPVLHVLFIVSILCIGVIIGANL